MQEDGERGGSRGVGEKTNDFNKNIFFNSAGRINDESIAESTFID